MSLSAFPKRKVVQMGLVLVSCLASTTLWSEEPKVVVSTGDTSSAQETVAWDQVLEQPASDLKLDSSTVEAPKLRRESISQSQAEAEVQFKSKTQSMDDVQVEPKEIMDHGVKMKRGSSKKGEVEREPTEKYLEATPPPSQESKIVDIYLENKSQAQGFLTGFTTKRADIDLKLHQHQPSDIPAESRFQIANFGNYIRIGHETTGHLIGYSTNYFGFTSVYLEKDYYEAREFWSRFKIAPSGQKDWYLIRSFTNPKKCLTIGWSKKLRLKQCNTKDKWQQWRFLQEKADAYWTPSSELINLDII